MVDPFGGYRPGQGVDPAGPTAPDPLAPPQNTTSLLGELLFNPDIATSTPMNFARDVSQAMAQGATFGFIDDLVAALSPQAGEEMRGHAQDFSLDYPALDILLKLTGGVGGGPGMLGLGAAKGAAAAGGTGIVPQVLAAGTGAGAAGGALTEAGLADGDFSEESLGDKLTRGAMSGGIMGTVVGAGIPAAQHLIRGGKNLLTGGATKPDAAQAVADTKVVESMRAAGQTPEEAVAAMRAAPPETQGSYALADTSRQTQRLARGAEAVPGRGSEVADEFFTGRGEGQLMRLEQAIGRVLRTKNPRDFHREIEDIADLRAQQADEAYEKAFTVNVGRGQRVPAAVEVGAEGISKLISRPVFVKAYDAVRKLKGDIAGEALPSLDQLKAGLDDGMIDARTIDLVIRRGINRALDAAEPVPGAQRGDPTLYRELSKFKDELLQEMEWAVPGYAKARAGFADKSMLIEAAEDGFNFDKRFLDPEHLAEHVGKLTDEGREMFILGVGRKLLDDMRGRAGGDLTRALLRNAGRAEKLKAILGDEAYEALEQVVSAERTMHQTKGMVLGGSPTARITEEVGSLPTDAAVEGLQAVLQMSLVPVARMAARAGSRAQGISPQVAESITDTLTTTSADDAAAVMQRLQGRTQDLETMLRGRQQVRSALPGAAAAGTRQMINQNQ